MYVIRWMGRIGSQNYLARISRPDVKAYWEPLREAKQFSSEQEAEDYITSADDGHRYWGRCAVVMFMHPLNIQG